MTPLSRFILAGSIGMVLGGCQGVPPRTTTAPAADLAMKTTPSPERIVNLGDSITDGQTYPLLVSQGLREAGRTSPLFIGAGIGGDVSAGMLKRLDRDVLARHPTSVMLCCGLNDLARGVPITNYEATVATIAERLKTEHVGLVLFTTSNLRGGKNAAELELLGAAVHRVAHRYGLPVAEVYDRMEEARKAGTDLWEADGTHLNLAGYRCLARAVLDVMGHQDVPVPTELHCTVLPGIIARWKVLTVGEKEPPLDAARVAALKVDDRWKDFTLPEKNKAVNWWQHQEQTRGYAISLNELFGGTRHYAIAELPSTARQAFINTGGELGNVWLNGQKLEVHPDRGWHAGGNRIAVSLLQGTNSILVETGSRFFISVTDSDTW